ncbi:hypothetical protein SLS56_010834 [Neofusicoccum ribis]|uniref:Methyltransferase n=1 Tax=Neofusicoccum ribis TaxID=45134 RepID=A0ABR3SDD3_9PEZI
MSAANASTDRFNAEAAAWDSNPVTVRSSELAYNALLHWVPELQDSKPDVLEIGCGTGLLSFHLSPHAHTLLGVDLAAGMVGAFRSKLASRPSTTNLAALTTFLSSPDQPEVQAAARQLLGAASATAPVRWDLVVSHLTLHHIPDMAAALRTCFAALRPGGRVALTDFEALGPRSVHFHPAGKRADVERHGIDRAEIRRLIVEAGFEDARVETAFALTKEVDPAEEGTGGAAEMEFPFLMCLGRKPGGGGA